MDEIDARLDGLRSRVEGRGKRLERISRSGWRERFGDRIDALETDLESFDPPVTWGRVQARLEEHRSAPRDGPS